MPKPEIDPTTNVAVTALAIAYRAMIEVEALREYMLQNEIIVDAENYKDIRRNLVDKILTKHADDGFLGDALRNVADDFNLTVLLKEIDTDL